ncbi:Hemolysin-type calcium-binding repeat-containing protein [Roseivivax lentus]|uniref:Hemolysin-type calcium-binding repeat-containing protein n=1 Tax=Roseivivax lentus TaxID=633194 RepID=A0A1N7Q540_9RHOB|nr:CAP domain-containing protein [Roseivivax lentus]SIT17926.1 Hemolysin-type calcium-binding repeat-containing protein [Roseivivax lentus]
MAIYLPPPEVTPSVAEQYYLCLINRDRADPAGAYDRLLAEATPGTEAAIAFFGVSLSMLEDQLAAFPPVPPLAWNGALASSAEAHSLLIVQYDTQSHNLPGEPGLYERIVAAGYSDLRAVAENVYAYSDGPLHGHAAFLIDWGYGPGGMQSPAGHRIAILSPTYTEIGIGIVTDTSGATQVGTEIVTQHFGTTWDPQAQIVGVVIDDADGDDFYDPGEGMGGVTVTATGVEETYVTTSWEAGGYQMALPPGTYTVTFSGGGLDGTITETVTVSAQNVSLDVEADAARPGGLTLSGGGGGDVLSGGALGDTLSGRGGGDTLQGGAGDDTISGGAGFDAIEGGDGADLIEGSGGFDTISGGAGDDTLSGNAGSDEIAGGTGADLIEGGIGADTLSGNAGADRILGADGADLISGQDDNDTLIGNAGADTLSGGDGADLLRGGINRDRLSGGEGADRLEGGDGWDTLMGGAGDDTLLGNAGSDTLTGGAGDDLLHGGIGADTFTFAAGEGSDTIVAFQAGIDTLLLDPALLAGADLADHARLEGAALILDFGAAGQIALDGVTDLTEIEADILWM